MVILALRDKKAIACGKCGCGIWMMEYEGRGVVYRCHDCGCVNDTGHIADLNPNRPNILPQFVARYNRMLVATHIYCFKCCFKQHTEDRALSIYDWKYHGLGRNDWHRFVFHGFHEGFGSVISFAVMLCTGCANQENIRTWLKRAYQLRTFEWGVAGNSYHDPKNCGCDRHPITIIADPQTYLRKP